MTALPQPNKDRDSRDAVTAMANALTQQAKSRAALAELDRHITHAKESSAEQLRFPWTTPDEREADMVIYYDRQNCHATILAGELQCIDGRPPTIQERLKYEEHFASELDAAGETWEEVSSYVWAQYQ